MVDNQEVLDLIEGKGGLLTMLDDAVMGVRQTEPGKRFWGLRSHRKAPRRVSRPQAQACAGA